jgi:predicted dehydrogenase
MLSAEVATSTVGLVGLGVIGRVHLQVLANDSRFALAFTADPRRSPADFSIAAPQTAHFDDLDAALTAMERGRIAEPDLVVLATPTRTHVGLASQVLSRTSTSVLSEKPLTAEVSDLTAFEKQHVDAFARVRVVNHFSFSPEVDWAARAVGRRGASLPQRVVSTFNDPYIGKSPEERATYVSSWVDSGPNQLGVLARFTPPRKVKTHTADPDGTRSVTELEHDGGTGLLVSNWHTGASSKHTALRWSDGLELLLDHTAMTALVTLHGRAIAHFGNTGSVDRKTAHYQAMYDALLAGQAPHLFDLCFARTVAGLLDTATTQSKPPDQGDWVPDPRRRSPLPPEAGDS